MEPGSSGQIILLVILICLSAFFSATETALTALSKIRLRNLVEQNVKNADKISKLLENPNKLLSAILIGNNLVNISATSVATVLFVQSYGQDAGVGMATSVMTIVILIWGEITPKTFASQNAEKIAFFVVDLISGLVFILSPLIGIINLITGFFIKILGGDSSKQIPLITEAELKTLVNVGHQEGVLELEERTMINNVFEFGDSQAKDVMTPRMDIAAVDKDTPLEEIMELFKEEGFSRIPVYDETIDDVIGILHLKDIVFADNKDHMDITQIMREPLFSYEYKSTDELFALMRNSKTQMAIILDEYGGTAGLVSIEDLVEEIVGDISDEYDEEEEEIVVINEKEYVVEGSAKINDVNEVLGTSLESGDFDSIGGYVIGLLGGFPEQDEVVESDDLKFVIEEIDKNRIVKLRIYT